MLVSSHEPSANLSERVRFIFNQRYYTGAAGSQRLSVFPGFSPVGIDIDRLRRYVKQFRAVFAIPCFIFDATYS